MRLSTFLRHPRTAVLARWGRVPGLRTAKATLAAVLLDLSQGATLARHIIETYFAEKDGLPLPTMTPPPPPPVPAARPAATAGPIVEDR